MSNYLVKSAWAPGLIGVAFSNLMYGASLGQTMHYVHYFPKDPSPVKLLVLLLFVADALHLVGGTQFFWNVLVLCHRSDTTACETDLTWGIYIVVFTTYAITFIVQSFYCHRIWIITGNRRSITLAVFLIAISQFILGIWVYIESMRNGTIKYLYTTPLVPLAAGVSTVCDILITSTVFKYLWMSELKGRSNIIRDLVVVFIQMGALTCLVSITVAVVYLTQKNNYWVGTPAIVLSRCYVNSLLAVLNARRGIRERERMRLYNTIEMPTLSTVL